MKGFKNPNYGKKISQKQKKSISHKLGKAVLQYDLNWNFVNEYYCAMEAQRQTKIWNTNIIKCCQNKAKIAGGYHWKYSELNEKVGE